MMHSIYCSPSPSFTAEVRETAACLLGREWFQKRTEEQDSVVETIIEGFRCSGSVCVLLAGVYQDKSTEELEKLVEWAIRCALLNTTPEDLRVMLRVFPPAPRVQRLLLEFMQP
jgi:hypothetical protein